MNIAFLTALFSAALVHGPEGDIAIEPGKQVPNATHVHVVVNDVERDITVPYLLFVPQNYESSNEKLPLLVFLHGSGECGNGGGELDRVKTNGPPKIVEHWPDFPFILVSPQCPPVTEEQEPTAWEGIALPLLPQIRSALRVDPKRVYITGLSMGGYGVWRAVNSDPIRFAAAVSVSGGGKPFWINGNVKNTSIWAFHGAKDTVVPLAEEQAMVDMAKRAGGDVKFTIYPDSGHDAWTETYSNHAVYDWLLAHKLSLSPEDDTIGPH